MQPFSQFVTCLICLEVYVQYRGIGQFFLHRLHCIWHALASYDPASKRLQNFDRAEIDQGFILQEEDENILKDTAF